MGQTRAEQETIFRWAEDEEQVSVWSGSPKTWRKLARLGVEPYKTATRDGEEAGRFYRVPVALFRWGLKGRRKGNAANLVKRPQP